MDVVSFRCALEILCSPTDRTLQFVSIEAALSCSFSISSGPSGGNCFVALLLPRSLFVAYLVSADKCHDVDPSKSVGLLICLCLIGRVNNRMSHEKATV